MKIDNEKFNNSLESFKRATLDASIKEAMKNQILDTDLLVAKSQSDFATKTRKLAAGLAIAFFGFGTLAFASSSSIPGDALYPFKTKIVEPLVYATKMSPTSKAQYQLKLSQKRSEESILLGEFAGKEIKEEVQKAFDIHINKAKANGLDVKIEQNNLFEPDTFQEKDVVTEINVDTNIKDSAEVKSKIEINFGPDFPNKQQSKEDPVDTDNDPDNVEEIIIDQFDAGAKLGP